MYDVSSAPLPPVGKIFATRLLKVLLLLGLATLALGIVGTKPASAQEAGTAHEWREFAASQKTCSYATASDTFATGAKVTMSAGGSGSNAVEQFRVRFLLYKLNPSKSSADAPEAAKSFASAVFGSNTGYDETWSASHAFRNLPSTGQYVLRAKYTFVGAPGYPDYSGTMDLRVCNRQEGGYVQNRYYAPK